MPEIDDIDSKMHLKLRRDEDKVIAKKLQEQKWKRKQLAYWWVANGLAMFAVVVSILQFFYTTSKESEQQRQIDKINIELKQVDRKYQLRRDSIEQVFMKRRDSLTRLRKSIKDKIK